MCFFSSIEFMQIPGCRLHFGICFFMGILGSGKDNFGGAAMFYRGKLQVTEGPQGGL